MTTVTNNSIDMSQGLKKILQFKSLNSTAYLKFKIFSQKM